MVISTLSAFLLVTAQTPSIVCPVMGESVGSKNQAFEYNGARFSVCCPQCAGTFEKNPIGVISKSKENKWVSGEFLFDPVSRTRINFKKTKGSSDFGSIRFYFSSTENKDIFDKNPKVYGTLPTKESAIDPFSQEKLTSYSKMTNYVDFEDVRVYYVLPAGKVISEDDLIGNAKDAAQNSVTPKVRPAPKATEEGDKSGGTFSRGPRK